MKKQTFITIWGDCVGLNDLVKSIGLSILLTMGAFFLADKQQPTQQLFFGLGGAVSGFIINSFLIKPKRVIKESNEESEENS